MIFNLQSIIVILLLAICTATYLRPQFSSYIDPKRPGFPGKLIYESPVILGMFGRFAVVGERLSPYMGVACIVMAGVTLFVR